MVLCSAKQYDLVFASASVKSRAEFRKTVRNFAKAYQQKLRSHEDLVRTFIGELKRHLKLSRRLFVEGSKGSRLRFIDYLKSAQKAGLVRKDIDPIAATDAFGRHDDDRRAAPSPSPSRTTRSTTTSTPAWTSS